MRDRLQNWRDPDYWRWRWQNARGENKTVLLGLLALLVGLEGTRRRG